MGKHPNSRDSSEYLLTSGNSILQEITKKSLQLRNLNQLVLPQLEAELRNQCQVANYRERCLYLLVESSLWANKLQYSLPQLKDQLKQLPEFEKLITIKVIISPPEKTQHPKRPPLTLSDKNRQVIQQAASAISDPSLKKALQRLAEGGQSLSTREIKQ